MAVVVSTPALRKLVAAQCRKSWNRRFSIPAFLQAVLKALLISLTGFRW